jgi:hypothetical protein
MTSPKFTQHQEPGGHLSLEASLSHFSQMAIEKEEVYVTYLSFGLYTALFTATMTLFVVIIVNLICLYKKQNQQLLPKIDPESAEAMIDLIVLQTFEPKDELAQVVIV